MRYISVDQSLASTAITFWEDDQAMDHKIIKTGSAWIKTKKKNDVEYFEVITDQIQYVVDQILEEMMEWNGEYCILESPAQSGFGNAVAALKTLFRAVEESFRAAGHEHRFFSIAPTSLKAYAREFLPEDERTSGLTKAGKPKKVKMEKKHVYKACKLIAPQGWLDANSVSNGGGDLADSFFLGHQWYHTIYEGNE